MYLTTTSILLIVNTIKVQSLMKILWINLNIRCVRHRILTEDCQ